MSTQNRGTKPEWMRDFHAKYGIWPIAGASSNEPPPSSGNISVSENDPPPKPAGENAGETPPATPAPTNSVDPNAFNRGTQETTPGQQQTQPGEPQVGEQNPATGRTFTAEEVETFRRQERDKLYPKIESMEAELRQYREEREREQRERDEAEARAQEEANKAEEEGLDVRDLLARKEQEWTNRFQELEDKAERDRMMFEKEREFNALQEYKRQQLEAHADDIMPQLRDLVDGNSEEEIQASIQRAIEKSNDILQNVRSAQQAQLQQAPTTRVTQPGAGGPMETVEQATREYSAQDIANMSMSEWQQKRDQFLGAAARRGPYGG